MHIHLEARDYDATRRYRASIELRVIINNSFSAGAIKIVASTSFALRMHINKPFVASDAPSLHSGERLRSLAYQADANPRNYP